MNRETVAKSTMVSSLRHWKYHLIQPKKSLPVSSKNPFKRLWTKWAKKGKNIRYPALMLLNHDEE